MRALRLRVGALAVALAALAAGTTASAMTFQRSAVGPECQVRACVLATGDIGAAAGDDFGRFLRRERIAPGALVIFDSDGGDVLAALRIGGQIRDRGLHTEVRPKGPDLAHGHCASACVYAFMGGTTRSVRAGARIGVHQMYGRYRELNGSDSQVLTALIAVHLKRCGGGMDLLISALRTPPQRMHWLSPLELSRYDVVAGEFTETAGLGGAPG